MGSVQKTHTVGFWSLVALVIGSQIGSAVLMVPSSLAPLGGLGQLSWLFSGGGAILLSIIFSRLCVSMPKTGGPHIYVEEAFGKTAGFFTAWTYWVTSWATTTGVVVAAVGYLQPLFGDGLTPFHCFILECLIVIAVIGINLKGIDVSGIVEIIFVVLKCIPLAIVPLVGLFLFNPQHFTPFCPKDMSVSHIINHGGLLTLWGFIGLETATIPAGFVKNPSKNIPRAAIFGTIAVMTLYIFNSWVLFGVVPSDVLAKSKAPYALAAQMIFGGAHWGMIISFIGAIICIGTVNAWVLASSQVGLGAAESGFFPKNFKKLNKNMAPFHSILLSSLGIIPLLFLTMSENIVGQLTSIIDMSVTAFLIVYIMCALSYTKLLFTKKIKTHRYLASLLIGILGGGFCGWSLLNAGLSTIICSLCLLLSGIPLYFWHYKPSLK